MISYQRATRRVRQGSTGAALAATAAVLGMGVAGADTGEDVIGPTLDTATALSAADGSSGEYFPSSLPYSADPSNVFSPVYTIEPTGPAEGLSTSAGGAVTGTQDFEVSSLGFPVDTFTGNFQYNPLALAFDPFGNPYGTFIDVSGTPGTLLPDDTGFLVEEFGFGYGNVFEESFNAAGTLSTIGDFVLTPFGDWNISPIVDFFASSAATDLASELTSALSALG